MATWALLGSLWEVLEASTEGISEAAAIRVAYHLAALQPTMAKKLSQKALFWSTVMSLAIASVLLLAGQSLIVTITPDYTLQHMLNNVLGLAALANISMSFAQVSWYVPNDGSLVPYFVSYTVIVF